jgi:hypothetical protein
MSLPGLQALARWKACEPRGRIRQLYQAGGRYFLIALPATKKKSSLHDVGLRFAASAVPDSYFYFHDGHPATTVQRAVARPLEREVNHAFE